MTDNSETELNAIRARIDALDEQMLALMNRRISEAQRIGEIKAAQDAPAFYRPEREARVLRRLCKMNRGPLDDAALEALFREIMSITRGSEAGLSAAILGPLGTYSEAAARRHFGRAVMLAPYASIEEIFRAVEAGQNDFAVVPVENSTEGGVSGTLDRLTTTSLLACGEINLRIHHNLLGRGDGLAAVTCVIAHAQSLAQCKRWLDRNLPGVELRAIGSNADAAVRARDDAGIAAIAGDGAAERYQLNHLAANIEDEPGNSTRFLVLSTRPTPPSGDDKTSLLLSCRNRPGALFHLLKPLMDHRVDMTRIESRPSKTGLWEYIFFVDIAGHREDAEIKTALQKLKGEAGLYKNLGSYPASSR
ncbi:MAG: prephenate dehydratase [Gammaproteobacteria bacterium]